MAGGRLALGLGRCVFISNTDLRYMSTGAETTEAAAPPFSLGLTYWPRRTAFGWWRAFDRGEAREELTHVAALGCDTVRLCLTWEDFQTGPQRLNSGALDALEHALDAVQSAGLRAVLGLFPAAIGGALWLPDWANGADVLDELARSGRLVARAPGGPALLVDGRYRANQAGDLFADARLLAAQRYLIDELVGYFGPHPAIAAWQLGEGLERVRRPGSAAVVRDWYQAMAAAIRGRRAGARVLGVVSAHALARPSGPRPEQLAESCDILGVSADPPRPPGGERANHGPLIAFLHALTAALAGRPALVTSLGLPTAPSVVGEAPGWIDDSAYGRPLRAYRGDEEQQAKLVAATLDRLQRGGATGAWLASYADYHPGLWGTPPLDRAIRERTLGLVDADGREKLAAAELRRFAAERRPVLAVAPALEADPERYWRDPRAEIARLWREFTTD
jgi:hypothetical protein